MKKNMIAGLSTVLFLICTTGVANADPINLNTWTQAGPSGSGNWVVAGDGSNVLQTINGAPTYFVSDQDYIETMFEGSFKVESAGNWDDDYIGFVFGWNGTDDFYLFDWKQGNQSGGALEGYTLSKISGTDVDFWNHTGADISVMATSYSTTSGWVDDTSYGFVLDYTSTSLSISIDGVGIFAEAGAFDSGKFGFYNYSQNAVRYQGFEESDIPVPEPTTMLLFGTGLVGLVGFRFRKKEK